ncbi:ribbon-helix-helix domain-containing protein [Kamptonema sp. UHCC 0994]|uniref:ribbon-helix-helix domain-containing protein n=1 Tax=Kamptonema sp. UHCC 0994 TaxID=3031329 RepID=UPI0023B9BF72|nr:ribbon-helix-helix domain-containing protein [Kamptonema sp. UHCC 0994]MDF0552676.1 ribbon-helix-helix domain-containing protein [Kamptonema sp. UHCC 0994]
MAKPKHKSMRNQPEMYDELKKVCTVSVTPTAIKNLDFHAKKSGISRSELIERFARSLNQLPEQPPTQTKH